MKTALLILLMFCLAEADDIRWEFQQFKRQLEEQHAAKFSELTSRLTASETKITEQKHKADQLQSSNEQFQDQLNLLTKQQDCLKRKLCEQDGFTYGDGLCYYISTETKTWDESRQWCRDRHSDLVIIKSKEKEDLVVSFNKPVWLGLTDKVTEGIFQWVDGTPLTTPTYWRRGQPGFQTSEYPNTGSDCVDYYDGSQSGTPTIGWSDAPCSDTLYWMCERSLC